MFNYDLHFTANGVIAITSNGYEFIGDAPFPGTSFARQDLYNLAIESGLQVSFDTAETRDELAAIRAL